MRKSLLLLFVCTNLFVGVTSHCGTVITSLYTGDEIYRTNYTVVGFYSFSPRNDSNAFNRDIFMKERCLREYLTHYNVYYAIDVCDRKDVLLESILTSLLEEKYSGVKLLLSYMSFEMTILGSEYISGTDIFYFGAYAHEKGIFLPNQFSSVFLFNDSPHILNATLDYYAMEGIRFISLVQFCNNKKNCGVVVDVMFSNVNVCFNSKNIVVNKSTVTDSEVQAFQGQFTIIYLNNVQARLKKDSQRRIFAMKKIMFSKYACQRSFPSYQLLLDKSHERYNDSKDLCLQDIYLDVTKYGHKWVVDPGHTLSAFANGINPIGIKRQLRYFTKPLVMNSIKEYVQSLKGSHRSEKHEHICKPKVCEKGKENVFGPKKTSWNLSRNFHCMPCQKNYVKEESGSHNCVQCPTELISNKGQTKCIERYEKIWMKWNDESSIIFLICCCLSWLIVVVFFTVIVVNINSPIVAASDKIITIWQMLFFSLLNTLLFTAFVEPSVVTCSVQLFSVGMFLTLPVGINLGKTHKLMKIFQSQFRVRWEEVRMTKLTVLLLVVLMILVDIGLLLMSVKISYPAVDEDIVNNKRYLYCNTNWQIRLQLVYYALLHIVNAIQGIRARRLPSSFKETIYIISVSFCNIIILCSATIVYISQTSQRNRDLLLLYTVLCLNFVSCFVLYYHKVYIIVFQQNLNTAEIVRKDILRRVDKNIHL